MAEPKPKRKRQTIVCSNCRKRKIKCDKERPSCGKCLETKVQCFYLDSEKALVILDMTSKDHFTQAFNEGTRNNGPKTDKIYGNLSEQTKSSFVTETSQECDLETQVENLKSELEILKQQLKSKEFRWDQNIKNVTNITSSLSDLIIINFYESYNSLMRKKSSFLESKSGYIDEKPFCFDNKPFSVQGLKLKDPYLRSMTFSVASTFEAVDKHLSNTTTNDDTQFKLFSNDDTDNDWFDIIREFTKDNIATTKFNEIFLPSIFGAVENASFNDLVKQIELALPDKSVYDQYVQHFLTSFQAYYPIVRVDFFEKLSSGPLNINPKTNRFQINAGNDWRQFAWLASLLVVLTISHRSWTADPSKSDEDTEFLTRYPISIELVTLAGQCLGHVNLFKSFNEDLLECLICIRTYFVFASGDINDSSPATDTLLNVITHCAFNMGIHRDPAEFVQYKDDNDMITLRRRLWIVIIIVNRVNMAITGQVSAMGQRFITGIDTSQYDPTDKTPKGTIMKEIIGMKHLCQLDDLTSNPYHKVSLGDLRLKLNKAVSIFEKFFPINSMQKHQGEPKIISKNMSIFNMNLLYSLNVLMIYASLANFFEYSENTRNPVLFKEFFYKTTKYTLKVLFSVINTLLERNVEFIDPKVLFIEMNVLYKGWERCTYLILSLLLRCLHTSKILKIRIGVKSCQSYNFSSIQLELHIVQQTTFKLFEIFKVLVKIGKEKLAQRSLSCLKTTLWFDHVLNQLTEHGFDAITNFYKYAEEDSISASQYKKEIFESTGFDLERFGIKDLDDCNMLSFFSMEDYQELLRIVDNSWITTIIDAHSLADPLKLNEISSTAQEIDFLNTMDTYDWMRPT